MDNTPYWLVALQIVVVAGLLCVFRRDARRDTNELARFTQDVRRDTNELLARFTRLEAGVGLREYEASCHSQIPRDSTSITVANFTRARLPLVAQKRASGVSRTTMPLSHR